MNKKIYNYVANEVISNANEEGNSVVDIVCKLNELSPVVACLRNICDDYKFYISSSSESGMCYNLKVYCKVAYPLF